MAADSRVQNATQAWFDSTFSYEYSYHFRWMGIPIIQYPQDMVAMQEIIWQVKPDLIIETGIARGGSLIFYASLLKMMEIDGEVLGIDIDIRPHNREAIEAHPVYDRISMLEGSSIDPAIIEQVAQHAKGKKRVLVALDSLHTHGHVAEELALYSPFVTKDSYLVVFDTVIEDMQPEYSDNRPWGHGDNPKTAVHDFLKSTNRFEIDTTIQNKLLITVAPDGYLRCLADA
ncbi:MAG: cephalosporin hydroxylase family protein [Chloroflexota bacterium]